MTFKFELVEKKNQPIKTKVKMKKNEYNKLHFNSRAEIAERYEIHESARLVWFEVDGDILNTQSNDPFLEMIIRG